MERPAPSAPPAVHTPPASLLVVEEDRDVRKAVAWLLNDVGYPCATASSLEEALTLLHTQAFHLVVTDLLDGRPQHGIPQTRTLLQEAAPTPTGLMTAWLLPSEWAERALFAFVVAKPFEFDELLSQIAATLHQPLTEAQQRESALVQQFFAALEGHDWAALRALCAHDVRYALNTPKGLVRRVMRGRQAYVTYAQQRLRGYPHARFTQVATFGLPRGIAARFSMTWTTSAADGGGDVLQGSGGFIFRFRDGRIAQIGVTLPPPLQPRAETTADEMPDEMP